MQLIYYLVNVMMKITQNPSEFMCKLLKSNTCERVLSESCQLSKLNY
jgi:hypothetical protein